jgi:lambda family phage tail tape measure protein
MSKFGIVAAQASNRVQGAFDLMASSIRFAFDWLERFGVGISIVFKSLLHEIDKVQGFNAIMNVTAGSARLSGEAFNYLRGTADQLGLRFDSLSSNYAKLVAAIPDGNDKLGIATKVFTGLSMAARTLHASNQDTQLMFYAVTQMASKGIVTMEELRRQLAEKLPGALQIAAKALNTTTNELETAIRKGVVDSVKFLPIFGDALVGTFAHSAEIASSSVSASINRLSNVWVDFTKQVIDSGSGKAIAGVFDALREKLSDPYVISRFAEAVGEISNRITGMIKGLSDEDIRQGFDTFVRGVNMIITVLDKLIAGLGWIINNSGKAGAGVGMIFGALQGAAIGTLVAPGAGTAFGAVAGGVLGAAGGAYVGNSIGPSAEQMMAARVADDKARADAAKALSDQSRMISQYIEPLLKLHGLNVIDAFQLAQPNRANQATVDTLVKMLTDPQFKTAESRRQGVLDYAQYGYVRGPSTATLADVIGKGKPDPAVLREARLAERQMWEGFGFQGGFKDEWNRLNKLYTDKKISVDELATAQDRLLKQQPVIREHLKEEQKAFALDNVTVKQNIDFVVQLLEARDKFVRENQDFIEALDVERASVGLSGRQKYVVGGLSSFDKQADELRRKASNSYELGIINRSIETEREARRKALGDTYDDLRSGASGLVGAYTSFFDELENRAAMAASTFNNIVGSMQDAWTNFVKTGKIDIKSFVSVIQTEIAKVTWAKFIAPAAAGAASWITGLFGLASGGIMSSMGPVPLHKYATGGIASSPQLAMYGEGSMNEAIIPLPDGRSVPVSIRGKSQSINIVQYISAGSNVSRSELYAAAMAAKTAAVNEIRENTRRSHSL